MTTKQHKTKNVTTTQSELDIEGLMGSHYMQAIMNTQVAKDNRSMQVQWLVASILAGNVTSSIKRVG